MPRDPRTTKKWKQVRERCYNRDRKRNAKCWICGGTINYRASNDPTSPYYSPNAWEGDHKISCIKHPEFAFDELNIFPSHASCNRSRGDKDYTGDGLGDTSCQWGI